MSGVIFYTSFVDGDGGLYEGPMLPLEEGEEGLAREILADWIANGQYPRSLHIDSMEQGTLEMCLDLREINRQMAALDLAGELGSDLSDVRDEPTAVEFPLTFSLN